MLEEEVKIGEQERESLRIETQRLRDELSDLRIEAEITQEKLRIAEATIERHHTRKPRPLATDGLRPPSPASEASTSATTTSSPTVSTPPPAKSETSTVQTTPPSPPLSDASANAARGRRNPVTPARQRTLDTGNAPKAGYSTIRQPPRHSRGPSAPTASTQPRVTPATMRRSTMRQSSRPSITNEQPLPRSESLYQIRGLQGKVQRLQERVHSVRSKLPAPTITPPRASPRGSVLGGNNPIPSSVTLRSGRKRTSNSTAGSDQQPVSRLSFGRSTTTRPEGSSQFQVEGGGLGSRPSSRASAASHSGNNGAMLPRPQSRTSMSGARTPSYYERRPRSSMSGSFTGSSSTMSRGDVARSGTPGPRSGTPGPRLGHGHGHSQSVSGISMSEDGESNPFMTPVNRRTTLEKGSAIPTPSGIPRRQSGGANVMLGLGPGRRSNIGLGDSTGPAAVRPGSRTGGDMAPPPSMQSQRNRKLSEVGETY
jgi:hypothetical protein